MNIISNPSGQIRVVLALLAIFGLSLGNAVRASEAFFTRIDAYRAGDDGFHSYRIPTLIATRSGTLLLFCDGRRDSSRDLGGSIEPVLRRSLDGGETWLPLQRLHPEATTGRKIGNASPVYDAQTDQVLLIYLYDLTQAYVIKSSDDGENFGLAEDITSTFKDLNYDWKYIATGHVHGIQTKAGDLVVPIWVNNVPRSNEEEGAPRNGIIYSSDHGNTWHAGGLVPFYHSLNESTVYETSDGALILNSRAKRIGHRVIARSADGGRTWNPPVDAKELIDPTCQGSTLVIPGGANGDRVLFCNLESADARVRLTVRMSYDGGKTWPIAKVIDEGRSAYSDMAIDGDGNIYVAYERGEHRPYDRVAIAKFNMEWLTLDNNK